MKRPALGWGLVGVLGSVAVIGYAVTVLGSCGACGGVAAPASQPEANAPASPSCAAPAACDPDKPCPPGCPPCAMCPVRAKAVPVVSTAALEVLLRAKVPLVLLDARSGQFDDGRRIPGARSLTAEATPEQAAAIIGSKDALIVTYCANLKCPASRKLAARLRELGYSNVIEYPAGIEAWVRSGRPTEGAPTKS